jgi:hypothetical protein
VTDPSVVLIDGYGDPAGWDSDQAEIWADGYDACREDILHNTVSSCPYEDNDFGFELWEAGYEARHQDSLNGTVTENPHEE